MVRQSKGNATKMSEMLMKCVGVKGKVLEGLRDWKTMKWRVRGYHWMCGQRLEKRTKVSRAKTRVWR